MFSFFQENVNEKTPQGYFELEVTQCFFSNDIDHQRSIIHKTGAFDDSLKDNHALPMASFDDAFLVACIKVLSSGHPTDCYAVMDLLVGPRDTAISGYFFLSSVAIGLFMPIGVFIKTVVNLMVMMVENAMVSTMASSPYFFRKHDAMKSDYYDAQYSGTPQPFEIEASLTNQM